MPPASQTIEFESYIPGKVLGIFKIIRGFADLAAKIRGFNRSGFTMVNFRIK